MWCSAETIREDFAKLTLAEVDGALAFYLDHQIDFRGAQAAGLDRVPDRQVLGALSRRRADSHIA